MEHTDEFLNLEWEVLNKSINITSVIDQPNLPKGKKEILIERDEEYNLKAIMYFKDPNFKLDTKLLSGTLGSFEKTYDIDVLDSTGVSYTLESSLITDAKKSEHKGKVKCLSTILLQGVKIKYKNDNDGTHLIEWYLNGPKDEIFHKTTNRKVSKNYFRERIESKGNKIDSIKIESESFSASTDFLRVNTDKVQFIIGKVPHKIGPDWSSNIGIEYRKQWGKIPEKIEREQISEISSFIFGRQILLIGYTIYDDDENLVEAYVRSPWGRSARSFCSQHDWPPINIIQGKTDQIINTLLQKYCEISEPLCLKEALWNYWISRQMPVGSSLPILAAGLETIINQWYKWKKTKSKGVYLEKENYIALLNEDLNHIESKLLGTPDGKKIMNNILTANEFGITERYKVFFNEMEMQVKQKEWDAINGRHSFVHGHALFDKTDWLEVVQQVQAFETLFNRVFLKLLEYNGNFIDRSTIGWPEVPLC